VDEAKASMTPNQQKYLNTFAHNLNDGIEYYNHLFTDLKHQFKTTKTTILTDLESSLYNLKQLKLSIEKL
ncbi:MAG: hypothetical protein Q7U08_08915, partial [Flavobacteriaceae bacterium]|nr:hypothetical protein [Flavobacteriaceae bacterium]